MCVLKIVNDGRSHRRQLYVSHVELNIETFYHCRVKEGVAIAYLGGALKSNWSALLLHWPFVESQPRRA